MMASDFCTRYDAACAELTASIVEWKVAERAMARANARRTQAEREVGKLYRERSDQINGSAFNADR